MSTPTHRIASTLFSASLWRPLLRGKPAGRLNQAMAAVRHRINQPRSTNQEIVAEAYSLLRSGYRTEYFYKNLITSNLFVGRHRATNSAVLHEFRIGSSIADTVFVNGKGTVYEVKTEFDDPSKLRGQLENYYQAFPLANVVVPDSLRGLYENLLEDSPAGLVTVGRRGHLREVKEPKAQFTKLSREAVYRTLRQDEVRSVLLETLGAYPEVPNGIRFRAYFEALESLSTTELQQQMQKQLKRRAPQQSRGLLLRPELKPIRTILVQLDPTQKQQETLQKWLASEETFE